MADELESKLKKLTVVQLREFLGKLEIKGRGNSIGGKSVSRASKGDIVPFLVGLSDSGKDILGKLNSFLNVPKKSKEEKIKEEVKQIQRKVPARKIVGVKEELKKSSRKVEKDSDSDSSDSDSDSSDSDSDSSDSDSDSEEEETPKPTSRLSKAKPKSESEDESDSEEEEKPKGLKSRLQALRKPKEEPKVEVKPKEDKVEPKSKVVSIDDLDEMEEKSSRQTKPPSPPKQTKPINPPSPPRQVKTIKPPSPPKQTKPMIPSSDIKTPLILRKPPPVPPRPNRPNKVERSNYYNMKCDPENNLYCPDPFICDTEQKVCVSNDNIDYYNKFNPGDKLITKSIGNYRITGTAKTVEQIEKQIIKCDPANYKGCDDKNMVCDIESGTCKKDINLPLKNKIINGFTFYGSDTALELLEKKFNTKTIDENNVKKQMEEKRRRDEKEQQSQLEMQLKEKERQRQENERKILEEQLKRDAENAERKRLDELERLRREQMELKEEDEELGTIVEEKEEELTPTFELESPPFESITSPSTKTPPKSRPDLQGAIPRPIPRQPIPDSEKHPLTQSLPPEPTGYMPPTLSAQDDNIPEYLSSIEDQRSGDELQASLNSCLGLP